MTTTARVQVSRAETSMMVVLAIMDCPNCGVIFGTPNEFDDRRRLDGKGFCCPNGHNMSYTKSELDKVREKLRQAERDRDWYKESEADQRKWRGQAERKLTATRGVVTKLRKRVVAGTCPFGCRRHFANLERHVSAKHPGLHLEGESE